MVCERCIISVKEALTDLPLSVTDIALGEVSFHAATEIQEETIEQRLLPLGFELLKDRKTILARRAKDLVSEVYSGHFEFPYNFRFFAFASEKLNSNHDTISEAFISTYKSTLEKYIIKYRVNKVKELLVYTEKSLADIAFSLGFSSVAHVSKQFKENTGLNTSHFRQIRLNKGDVQSVHHS